MNAISRAVQWRWGLLLWLGALPWCSPAAAVWPVNRPMITSLSASGSNLVFAADFPSGVDRAVLQMRPQLTGAWQPAATLTVPAAGGTVEFAIPKPACDAAFFRLNVSMLARTNVQVSTQLRYVTTAPLASVSTNPASPAEAVFHFRGMIDGSDRIVITHQGAFWQHVNWGWPAGPVTVNGSQWDPAEKNYLTTTGAVAFLPESCSLAAARLETIAGRDVLALERTNHALVVYLDDTPWGAAPYEFKIHFPLAVAESVPAGSSTAATLKITAQIDGSDLLKLTTRAATWTHRTYAFPTAVRLNDVPWDVRQTNVLWNAGTNVFLPTGVDLSTARIIHREGRDLVTMWADRDAVWVWFADNPDGAAPYELDLSFGQ